MSSDHTECESDGCQAKLCHTMVLRKQTILELCHSGFYDNLEWNGKFGAKISKSERVLENWEPITALEKL